MANGYFLDDPLTTPLTEVVQTDGTFPERDGGVATDEYVGLIRTFAFGFAPDNATLAQGQSENGSTNSVLFSIIGTLYGGNGDPTYDLPNLQGIVPVGASYSNPVGRTSGSDTAQVDAAQFPHSLGGVTQAVPIGQPTLAITYIICVSGDFPSPSSSAAGAFLGEVLPFLGNYAPSGFAVADGAVLSITQNQALYAVLGKTYGGDGTTTFALPNLEGRAIVGASSTLSAGSVVGQSSVTLTKFNLPEQDGGFGETFNDQGPSLALNYIICVNGVYPTRNSGDGNMGSSPILGEVRAFAGSSTALPKGWMLANGQVLSIQQNAPLFTLLGTAYGGNGTTTFALPNWSGSAVSGSGTRSGTTYSDGETFGNDAATFVVTNAACYCSGTLILTAHGQVAVEDLTVGDLVVTASGEHRPIRWLGHRKINCRSYPDSTRVMPIRIGQHALGVNKPARDLYVSPAHAICITVIEDVLVPASALVNGTTIVQLDVEETTYWHLELECHDIILAESLPAESYLEMGNRSFFKESDITVLDALPDATAHSYADYCRPFHTGGPLVDAIRQQTRTRSRSIGWRLDESPLGDLHLLVDGTRIDPTARGLVARFAVPAGAEDVWLVSNTSRPVDSTGAPDARDLGACIAGFSIDDSFAVPYKIDLADPLLCAGFHALEEGPQRWTSGRARLPAALWAGRRDGFFLRVDLAGPAVPRWVAPEPQPCVLTSSRTVKC